MPFTPILRPICFVFILAVSGNLYADNTIYRPTTKIQHNEANFKHETQRHQQILQRTQNVISLLAAEMADQQGDKRTSIGMYLNTLRDSKNPDVAERAMELAINAQAYSLAERIYHQWREIEPTPSPAQRRMAWTRALILGDPILTMPQLNNILTESNEKQQRRIFLQLAQMSMLHDNLVENGRESVHQAAQLYAHLSEAHIADIFYNHHNQQHSLHALSRLAELEKEPAPATLLTLEVLARTHPELLNLFFEQKGKTLPSAWQDLYIGSLIQTKQYTEAQNLLMQLLDEDPSATRYIQAAMLANATGQKTDIAIAYLDKARQTGNSEQKQRAALIGAIHLAQDKRYREAQEWAEPIKSTEFIFDKILLQASIAADEQRWQDAQKYLNQAQKLPEKRGLVFTRADAERIHLLTISQTGKPEQTLAELNRSLKRAESQNDTTLISSVLFQRGLLYADTLQQTDKAIADFRRFMQLNPNHTMGMNALGYTLLSSSSDNWDEAFKLIQAAYENNEDNPQINDSLGWAYHKKGDSQTALAYLEFAYAQEPDPEIAAHLGEVYYALGKKTDAEKVWRQAWQKNPRHKILLETLKRHGLNWSPKK